MKGKLTLELDDLLVDSFDTTVTQKEKGTVFGEQCTCYTQCTCPGCPSCYDSCNGTCGDTCPATCAWTCDDYSCAGSCDGTCNASDCAPCWNTDPRFTGCGPYHCP